MENPIKRINLHLYVEDVEAIDRFAKVMGCTRAAAIRGLMHEAVPSIIVLTDIMEGHSANPDPVRLEQTKRVAAKLATNLDKGLAIMGKGIV